MQISIKASKKINKKVKMIFFFLLDNIEGNQFKQFIDILEIQERKVRFTKMKI